MTTEAWPLWRTPGEIADKYGTLHDGNLQAFLDEAVAAQKLAAAAASAVTFSPDRPDPAAAEGWRRYEFMHAVGRQPSRNEVAGRPERGCADCGRLGGDPCDQHGRRAGDPIELPPRPWPSDAHGVTPGTVVTHRPGNRHDVLDTVQ